MLSILRKLSLLFLLKFKERVHFIIFITLLYTAISFVIRHGQTKQSSKYRDREGYLLEVHAKPHSLRTYMSSSCFFWMHLQCVVLQLRRGQVGQGDSGQLVAVNAL